MTKRALQCAPLILAAAAIAFAAGVSVDYDHHADFSALHTYSWIGASAGDQLWQNRIMRDVDAALASKGWTKVPSGGDAAVSAVVHVTERDTLETFYNGFPGWGWRRGWGGGVGMATTTEVPDKVGNLTVDVFQAGNKQLLWRATASQVLSTKSEKNEKKLQESVDQMFKKFPPPGKT